MEIDNEKYFKEKYFFKISSKEKYNKYIKIYSNQKFNIKIKYILFTDEELINIKEYIKKFENQNEFVNMEFLRNFYKRIKLPKKIKIENQIYNYQNKKSLITYKKFIKKKFGEIEKYKVNKNGILVIINFGKNSENYFHFNGEQYILNKGETLMIFVNEKEYEIKSDLSKYNKYLLLFIIKYEI